MMFMKKKFIKLMTICMAAVMLLTVVLALTAFSNGSDYEVQQRKYEERTKKLIAVDINCSDSYTLETSKFYGREILGVDNTGEIILGPWQCLDGAANVTPGTRSITIPGTYAQFAYSCDILGGTDFPFSGVFWTNIDKPIDDISIYVDGMERMVEVDIYVNNRLAVDEYNCDSHSEWKP